MKSVMRPVHQEPAGETWRRCLFPSGRFLAVTLGRDAGSWFKSNSSCSRARIVLLSAALSLGLLMPGCQMVNKTASLPMNAISAVVPGSRSSQLDAAALQVELQRFADEYAGRTIKALDDYAQSVGTDEARRQVLVWKVSVSAACVSIASGPNPTANLLDFLALATITRTALEEDWVKSAQGKAFQPWLDSSRKLETNAWKLAEGILQPGQQQELRDSIQQWWVSNAETRAGFFTRPQEFSALIRQTGKRVPVRTAFSAWRSWIRRWALTPPCAR